MRNILIPFDFSEVAENAMNYAISLFKNTEANFYLLYVNKNFSIELLIDEYDDNWFNQIDDSVLKDLKQYADELNKIKYSNHRFFDIVLSNSLIDSIKYVLKVESIDIIISGTKGARDRSGIFITTRTLTMIKRIHECPVLVVPYDYNFTAVKKVIFSTNFKQMISTKQLRYILDICKLYGACLEVVNLTEGHFLGLNQKENKKALEAYLSSVYHHFKKIDWLDSESKTLMNYMKSSDSQLLCIINYRQNFFDRLIEEDVIKRTSFYSQIPLLFI